MPAGAVLEIIGDQQSARTTCLVEVVSFTEASEFTWNDKRPGFQFSVFGSQLATAKSAQIVLFCRHIPLPCPHPGFHLTFKMARNYTEFQLVFAVFPSFGLVQRS
jgi:hypothetical protein